MNVTLTKTLMGSVAFIALAVPLVAVATGCSVDDPATVAVEATSCAGSWLNAWSPVAGMVVTTILLVAGGAIKAFGKSGTVKQNLLNPTAPIAKPGEPIKPGVVTPAQVESTSGKP